MNFHFSRQNLKGGEALLERLFEILPAATSGTILMSLVLFSFWKPILAAVLIIAFDFYWLLRLFYMTIFLVLGYFRLSLEQETDWMERIHGLTRLDEYLAEVTQEISGANFKKKLSLWLHKRQLEVFKQRNFSIPFMDDIYHVILLPVIAESEQVVEAGMKSFTHQQFPSKRILLVVALEDRSAQDIKRGMLNLQTKYRSHFLDFLIVTHPDGLPGEARVKGANISYAAREAKQYLETRGIDIEHVIASCFDADTIVNPDYFSCLAYRFMVCPNRTRASFQPIPVYYNNIWEASGFARVLDIGSSFFQMIEATNPDKLITFSSHSMSFKALVEVDYWPVDMISDDSAIFWKAFIHFDGDYEVVPMYVTISMDMISSGPWWRAIADVYKQKRRWAWGDENFPIVMRAFLKARQIPFFVRFKHAFKLFGNHVSWATWGFLLTVVGWFPALFAQREFSDSVLYYSAPRITSTIFNLASLGLVTTIVLSLLLLPKNKVKRPFLQRIVLALEWLFVPFVITFLSALPALNAQIRLALGRYMEFWVSEKRRR